MNSATLNQPIVIDNGTGVMAGFGGTDKPNVFLFLRWPAQALASDGAAVWKGTSLSGKRPMSIVE